ncbi:MAG: phosphate ABC transporter ATP-binding protein [Firmicutes bacterium]|nr:phosphate ABC transporter ATP-binding protein [Bacillota bacterium]
MGALRAADGFSVSRESVAVEVKDLHAFYGRQEALKGVTMMLPANAVTAIIGPSGCGKSTFIRCLNRMHEEVEGASVQGAVIIGEANIYAPGVDPVEVRRRVGMVFQRPNPFPHLSVFENVAAGLRLNGMHSRSEIADRVEEALRLAALWDEVRDRLSAPGTSLSGGQQQRLCIARAIALQPQVLLMDEPASALDPVATSRIEELAVSLKSVYTIVIVTHNMQQAARIADKTAFFWLGELVEFDDTDTIFTLPKDKRTEDYVRGRMG